MKPYLRLFRCRITLRKQAGEQQHSELIWNHSHSMPFLTLEVSETGVEPGNQAVPGRWQNSNDVNHPSKLETVRPSADHPTIYKNGIFVAASQCPIPFAASALRQGGRVAT